MSKAGRELIFPALRNQFPDSPVWKNEVPVNAIGAIPDGATLTKTFVVTKMLGTIKDVMLDLDIRHPRRGDLIITLTSPRNKAITIFKSVASKNANPANLITTKQVLGFSGQLPNGTWKLSIKDAYRTRSGSFNAASLHLTTQ